MHRVRPVTRASLSVQPISRILRPVSRVSPIAHPFPRHSLAPLGVTDGCYFCRDQLLRGPVHHVAPRQLDAAVRRHQTTTLHPGSRTFSHPSRPSHRRLSAVPGRHYLSLSIRQLVRDASFESRSVALLGSELWIEAISWLRFLLSRAFVGLRPLHLLICSNVTAHSSLVKLTTVSCLTYIIGVLCYLVRKRYLACVPPTG